MFNLDFKSFFKRRILSSLLQSLLIVTIVANFGSLSFALEPLKLNDSYALEAMDPKHRYADGLNQVYSKWSRIQEIAGTHFSSEDEAKKAFIKDLNAPGSKISDLIGKGLDEKTRKAYRGGVTYMTPSQRAEHEVVIKDGEVKLKATNEKLPPGEHMFVIGPDKKVYAARYERGHMHHSSFFSGAPVVSAGMITVGEDGKVAKFTNKSGHYTPSLQHMQEAAKVLNGALSKGARLEFMEITTARDGQKSVRRQTMTREKLGLTLASQEPSPETAPETAGNKPISGLEDRRTEALERDFAKPGADKESIVSEAERRLGEAEWNTPDKAKSRQILERIVVTGAPERATPEMLERVYNDPKVSTEAKRSIAVESAKRLTSGTTEGTASLQAIEREHVSNNIQDAAPVMLERVSKDPNAKELRNAIGEEATRRINVNRFSSEASRQTLHAIQEEHLGLAANKETLHTVAKNNVAFKNGNAVRYDPSKITEEKVKSAKDTLMSKRVILHGTTEEKHDQAQTLVEHALKKGNQFNKATGLSESHMHEMLHERNLEGGEHSVKGQVAKMVSSGHISAHEGVNIVKAKQAFDSPEKVEASRQKVEAARTKALASGLKMGRNRARAASASTAANHQPTVHTVPASHTTKPLPKTPVRRVK